MASPDRIALSTACTRFLSGHGRGSARAWTERLLASPHLNLALDEYSAGPADFIAAAKPWRNRYGGDLAIAFPFIVTALDGLEAYLPRMAIYHDHAKTVAASLAAVGLTAHPAVPHGNSFQVHFPVSAQALTLAAHDLAANAGIWLFSRISEAVLPGTCFTEIAVGEATLGWSADEIATTLLQVCRSAG